LFASTLRPPLVPYQPLLSCHLPTLLSFSIEATTTHIYTLSLHDALPIYIRIFVKVNINKTFVVTKVKVCFSPIIRHVNFTVTDEDRKSTRLNSSHVSISYAVFCLKKKTRKEHRNLNADGVAYLRTSGMEE